MPGLPIPIAAAALGLLLGLVAPAAAQSRPAPAACPPLLQQTVPRLQDDKPQDLCQYAGRVLLVVNTASYCGFTSQFEGLEALNARYAARGLVVMGFPSGDFKQEDKDAKKTAEVCFNTYGVKFPMFATGARRRRAAHLPPAGPGHRPAAELELQQVPRGPRRQAHRPLGQHDRAHQRQHHQRHREGAGLTGPVAPTSATR
jgi:hypothetical protein